MGTVSCAQLRSVAALPCILRLSFLLGLSQQLKLSPVCAKAMQEVLLSPREWLMGRDLYRGAKRIHCIKTKPSNCFLPPPSWSSDLSHEFIVIQTAFLAVWGGGEANYVWIIVVNSDLCSCHGTRALHQSSGIWLQLILHKAAVFWAIWCFEFINVL